MRKGYHATYGLMADPLSCRACAMRVGSSFCRPDPIAIAGTIAKIEICMHNRDIMNALYGEVQSWLNLLCGK